MCREAALTAVLPDSPSSAVESVELFDAPIWSGMVQSHFGVALNFELRDLSPVAMTGRSPFVIKVKGFGARVVVVVCQWICNAVVALRTLCTTYK